MKRELATWEKSQRVLIKGATNQPNGQFVNSKAFTVFQLVILKYFEKSVWT